MSLTTLTQEYYCQDDCRMSGCPGHTAQFKYHSSSDTFTLDFGRFDGGQPLRFSGFVKDLETLYSFLQQMESIRAEFDFVRPDQG